MRFLIFFLFLGKVNILFSQVNLQTGSAEQSLPLVNYEDAKSGLNLSVALNYSSGNGLTVNDYSSDVGSSWGLEAGGSIVRQQIGEPDDQPERNVNQSWAQLDDEVNKKKVQQNYPAGYWYNANTGAQCNTGLSYYPVFKKQSLYKDKNITAADMEPDRFSFHMNGRSGTFLIGKDRTVVPLGDSKMKFNLVTADMTSLGIRTVISQFEITTEDGIKYIFRDKVLSRVLRYKYSVLKNGLWVPDNAPKTGNKEINRYMAYAADADERPYVVNSWLLSEIQNTNTQQKIVFNYQDVHLDLPGSKILVHEKNLNKSRLYGLNGISPLDEETKVGSKLYQYLSNPTNANNWSNDIQKLDKLQSGPTSITYLKSISESKRITSILLPNGGMVKFIYNPLNRKDVSNENALSRIDYFTSAKLIRSFTLQQGYFYKNAIRSYIDNFSNVERKFLRLCLLSIQKVGNGLDNASEPPYQFDYYYGSTKSADDIVPAQNFLAQDHWGYYNGDNSKLALNEDHDFLSDERNQYLKAVLPVYKIPKIGYAKNGLLKKMTYPTGGSLSYEYTQNQNARRISGFSVTDVMSGGVGVSRTVIFDANDHSKDIITTYTYKGSDQLSSKWQDEAPVYYGFSVNKYGERVFNKLFKYPGVVNAEMSIDVNVSKILLKTALGIGIGVGTQLGVEAGLTALQSTAAIPYVNIAVFVYSLQKIITDLLRTQTYYTFTLSNLNYSMSNPLPTMFSRVEVATTGSLGYNGKTVYEFTDLKDKAPMVSRNEWPYIARQRIAPWAYGLPKRVLTYDRNNFLVHETDNAYSITISQMFKPSIVSCKCATVFRTSIPSDNWDAGNRTNFTTKQEQWMIPRPYSYYTGRTDLSSTTEKVLKDNALVFSTTTNLLADAKTLLQKETTTMLDPVSLQMNISYYPTDFSTAIPAINFMRSNNVIQIPISTETWKSTGNSRYLMDEKVTEFKLYSFTKNGISHSEVKPYRIYQLKSDRPVSVSQAGRHNSANILRPGLNYKVLTEYVYDTDGNLVGQIVNDIQTSFVNDYHDRYTTATAVNADYHDIAFSSFEADGNGGWDFDNRFVQNSISIAGRKSFKLGYDAGLQSTSTLSKTGLTNSKTYQVSLWINDVNSTIQINGQPLQKMYSRPDGWTFYKNEVSNATQITIAGTGNVDDVQLYPKNSSMITTTYEEGIGKTAESDANGRITFYEYDALGRPKLVKDQNLNIIKTYEYHYAKH